MYRTQSNMDERLVVFSPRSFSTSSSRKKTSVFLIFLWEKITKKISMLQYTLTWGLPSIRKKKYTM